MPHFNVEKWLDIKHYTNSYSHNPYWYHPRDINDLPDHSRPHANDTSACAGYWPMSNTERLVLALEGHFYEGEKPKYDYIGQDIKCLAVRRGKEIDVTMCIPFISTLTPDVNFYQNNLEQIVKQLEKVAAKTVGGDYKVRIVANTVDNPTKNDYYLLLTGSCLEAGEEGLVGRGNRSRGTIASTRPYSMEASNGKNPVYHVGKVYTVIVDEIAKQISEKFECFCNVYSTTKNGDDLYDPNNLIVETSKQLDQAEVRQIVEEILSSREWTGKLIGGHLIPKRGKQYLKNNN